MLGRIFTVGGYTLLSRLTGFARDIMLAAILGAGPVADAFFVALRLPNHFRAIFAEGAFNAAFVPAYAHLHSGSETSAKLFADRIFTLLFSAQAVLLVVAWLFMPQVIAFCRDLRRSSSTTTYAPFFARSGLRRSARWGRRSRCSPIPSSRPFCPQARCRRCIMPTGSISCRSA